MKFLLVLALVAFTSPLAAQTGNTNSKGGTIERIATETATPQVDRQEADFSRAAPADPAAIPISRDPKDMDDTTGMEMAEVLTWVDRNGVRSYTDDPKRAPANAKTKRVYSMPAATPTPERNQRQATPGKHRAQTDYFYEIWEE